MYMCEVSTYVHVYIFSMCNKVGEIAINRFEVL